MKYACSILILFLILSLSAVMASPAQAAAATAWTGAGDGSSWSKSGNWSNGVPGSGVQATIDLDAAGGVEVYVDINTAVCGHLVLTSGTLRFDAASILTCDRLSLSGELSMTGGTLNFLGNADTFAGGSASLTGGLVRFIQTVSTSFNFPTWSYYSVEIACGGSTTIAMTGNATCRNLTLTSGTFSAASHTLTVLGVWAKNGGIYASGTGTVAFQQSAVVDALDADDADDIEAASSSIGGSQSTSFNNLTMSGAGLVLGTDTVITGNFTQTTGAFSLSAYTLTLHGNFTRSSGTIFNANTGTVAFLGTGTSVIGGTTDSTFYNLTVAKSGAGAVTLGRNTTVTHTVLLTSGILNGSALTLNVAGDWTNNGATFSPGTGTVVFNGTDSPATVGGTNGTTFNNLTLNKSRTVPLGYRLTVAVNTTVNGNVLLTSGDLVINASRQIDVKGNWTNNGADMSPNATSTVKFTGTAVSTIGGTQVSSFGHLTLQKTGQTVFLTNASTVSGTLTLSTGFLNYSGSGNLPGASRSLSAASTKVTFSGGSNQDLSFGASAGLYNDLEIDKTGGVATVNASSPSLIFGNNWGVVSTAGIVFTRGAVTQSASNQGILSLGGITIANNASVVITGNEAPTGFYTNWSQGASATYNPGVGALTGVTYVFGSGGTSSISGAPKFNNLFVAKAGGGVTSLDAGTTITNSLIAWNYNSNQANFVELNTFTHTIGSVRARGVPEGGSVNLGQVKFETSTVNLVGAAAIDNSFVWGDAATQQLDFGTGAVRFRMAANTALQGNYPFYTLVIDTGNAYTVSLQNNLTIGRDLSITSGTLDVTSANYSITVNRNWGQSGGFLPRAGTVIFGTAPATANITGTVVDFYAIQVNKIGSSPTVTVSAAINFQTLDVYAGTLIAGNSIWRAGQSLNVHSGGVLRITHANHVTEFTSGATVVIDGLLESQPTSNGPQWVCASGDGNSSLRYGVTVNGEVRVNSMRIRHLNDAGLTFNDAALTNFRNVSLSAGGAGAGSRLLAINTSGTLVQSFSGISFDRSTTYNVKVSDSTPSGDSHVTFENLPANGVGAGEAYDFDGDRGVNGDAVADDGVSTQGEAVCHWRSDNYDLLAGSKDPNPGATYANYPIIVLNYSTFQATGILLGFNNWQGDGEDLLAMFNPNGDLLDTRTFGAADGDILSYRSMYFNEAAVGFDANGDGDGNDASVILVFVALSGGRVYVFDFSDGASLKDLGGGNPWGVLGYYDGPADGISAITSHITVNESNVYFGATVSGVEKLCWVDHKSMKLSVALTPAGLPTIQSSLMVIPEMGADKAHVGSARDLSGDGHFYKIDAGGSLLIETDYVAVGDVQGVPSYRNGIIMFGDESGRVYAVSDNGYVGRAGFPRNIGDGPVRGGIFQNHLSYAYGGTLGGTLFCLSPSGAPRYQVTGLGAITTAPVAVGGTVMVAAGNTVRTVSDNPASPVVLYTYTGSGPTSNIVVNPSHATGPKFIYITGGTFVMH